MKLPRSAENALSWRSQYNRLERWFARLSEPVSDIEKLDFYLAFFMNCYALRDWLIKSEAMAKQEIDRLVFANQSMCICRDVCNRSKHLLLTSKPSADAHYQIAHEYMHHDETTRWFIVAAGMKRDLFDLAATCMTFWRVFLEQNPNLPEASYL